MPLTTSVIFSHSLLFLSRRRHLRRCSSSPSCRPRSRPAGVAESAPFTALTCWPTAGRARARRRLRARGGGRDSSPRSCVSRPVHPQADAGAGPAESSSRRRAIGVAGLVAARSAAGCASPARASSHPEGGSDGPVRGSCLRVGSSVAPARNRGLSRRGGDAPRCDRAAEGEADAAQRQFSGAFARRRPIRWWDLIAGLERRSAQPLERLRSDERSRRVSRSMQLGCARQRRASSPGSGRLAARAGACAPGATLRRTARRPLAALSPQRRGAGSRRSAP